MPSRTPAKISESLHRQLNSYALAASAAGVAKYSSLSCAVAVGAAGLGILISAQPAEARIIYTHVHKVIPRSTNFGLDLNNDGVADFVLNEYALHTTWESASALTVLWTVAGNEAVGKSPYASALRAGVRIDPRNSWVRGGLMAERLFHGSRGTTWFSGPWENGGKGLKNRYLGLKFVIEGKIHYGWARLSVRTDNTSYKPPELGYHYFITATLTGYAYETIPNKPIIAGKTHGPDVITVQPATLGHLARGASAISTWRARESQSKSLGRDPGGAAGACLNRLHVTCDYGRCGFG
jgi:hypothetical protein